MSPYNHRSLRFYYTVALVALLVPLIWSVPPGAASEVRFYGQVEKNFGQPAVLPTTVRVCGEEVFNIPADAGGFTKIERAIIVERNINNALIASGDHSPASVEVVYVNNIPVVRMGGKHVVTADSASAKVEGTTMAALAEEWAGSMRRAMSDKGKVEAYVASLGGDFLSPYLGRPYRYARCEAARLNHAAFQLRAALPPDLQCSDSFEDAGMTALLKRDLLAAEESFKQAIAMNPGNHRAQYGLGVTFLKQGKVEAAIPHLELARWIDHDDAQVHLALGQAHEALGNDRLAITRYREASLLQPENPEPYLYIADLREERNDMGKSVRELSDAMAIVPDSQYLRLRRNDQLTWRLKRPF